MRSVTEAAAHEETPLVQSEIRDAVAFITLDNPARRNAMSFDLMTALQDALEAADADARVRAIIIRANGPVFSAGHDLRQLVGAEPGDYEAIFALCTRLMLTIRRLDQPVIAQVHALATAAGCQLVAACDLAVASEEASFATPGVRIGLFCSTPGVAVSRVVPTKKAMEMLLTGQAISAAEAERIGLVNRVVPAAELAAQTESLARTIAEASGHTVGLGKQGFYRQLEMDLEQAYAFTQDRMVENLAHADADEGIRAFLEKRPPRWNR
jgi:enoyl-CoA hydratase/carnithine racemase